MARIRSIKPELRTSDLVASWPFEMRYFFVLLWGYLDDKGRGLDVPKTIAGDCFPHDEKITPSKVDKWLDRMRIGSHGKEGPICRYEVDGRRYLHCRNWGEHQKPNRPTPSRLPRCPIHEPLTEDPLSDSVPGAGEQGSRGEEERGSGGGGQRSGGSNERGKRTAADLNATAHTPTAHAIVEGYAKTCRKRPPSSVLTELAVQVDGLLAEDWSEPEITKAVQAWSDKRLHPKTLPSVAHEVANSRPRASPRKPNTDDRIVEFLSRSKNPEHPQLPPGGTA